MYFTGLFPFEAKVILFFDAEAESLILFHQMKVQKNRREE